MVCRIRLHGYQRIMHLGLLHRRFALVSSKECLTDNESHFTGVALIAVTSWADRNRVEQLLVDYGRKLWWFVVVCGGLKIQ